MEEYWIDQFGQNWKISEMETEHIINAVEYLKWKIPDWWFDYISAEDDKERDRIEQAERKYQALLNELTIRLAKKFLLGDDKTNVE